jgi:hypothetical protein
LKALGVITWKSSNTVGKGKTTCLAVGSWIYYWESRDCPHHHHQQSLGNVNPTAGTTTSRIRSH